MKTVTHSALAERKLAQLPTAIAARIEAKIERYALTGEGDVKALTGLPTLRLRVGMWRVNFTEDLHVIAVFNVGHRGDVYR